MFTDFHRRKGGALALGAREPGQHGPFGVFPHPGEVDAEDVYRPALERWLAGAGVDHPVRQWPDDPDRPVGRVALDILDEMLDALDQVAGDDVRWRAKRTEFARLTSHDELLEMRGEFAVARALAAGGVRYLLGNTKVSNPDFLLMAPGGGEEPTAGVEVTAVAPQGVPELVERIETELGGLGVQLEFSSHPSRLQDSVVEQILAAVRGQALAAAAGRIPAPVVIEVDDRKNVGTVSVTIRLSPDEEPLQYVVRGGELAGPMASVEYALFQAGNGQRKAAQGRSLGAAPVMLAVDVSRYGAAAMRSDWVWAGALAASELFTPAFPFAAIAVFQQSLTAPAVLNAAVGISPHLDADARRTVVELSDALGWHHA